jgi:uncharacterized membrane protein
MALSVVATITIFVVPESDVPLAYLRSSFGIIFVLFLPGFALIKALFPAKVPFQTSSDDMDAVERIALSFGMSLALVPMFGLILYFSPWGLGLTSITLSLLVFSIIFATIAVLREHQTKVQTGKSAPNFKTKK